MLRGRNKLCLANEVVTSYTLKLIIMNYANLLAKYFFKHIMFYPTRKIMWNTYKCSNMISNVDDRSLDNPGVSCFGELIRNVYGI